MNWPMGATSRPGRGQWRAWPARLKAKCANESASHCCLIDSLAQGCSRYICMYVLTLYSSLYIHVNNILKIVLMNIVYFEFLSVLCLIFLIFIKTIEAFLTFILLPLKLRVLKENEGLLNFR